MKFRILSVGEGAGEVTTTVSLKTRRGNLLDKLPKLLFDFMAKGWSCERVYSIVNFVLGEAVSFALNAYGSLV